MTDVRSMQRNEGCEVDGEEFLPGISNDIVLAQITPILSWRDFYTLSSVSRSWHHAIQSRRVYDARVRSHSTETLIVFEHGGICRMSLVFVLYDMRDGSCFRVPPMPYVLGITEGHERFPHFCQCVSLDGKIYVLGGVVRLNGPCSDKVFVLDIAGQRQWKECAPMKVPRQEFGCGVIGRKIYVCGGISSASSNNNQPVYESEVYDPDENVWSPIKPMISLQFNHRVETVGEELFVYSGSHFDRNFYESTENRIANLNFTPIFEDAMFLEVYHPGKDEWRVVQLAERGPSERDWQIFFAAQGRFFSLSETIDCNIFEIHILDADGHSWTHLHTFRYAFHWCVQFDFDVLAVDDKLLATVFGWNRFQPVEFVVGRGLSSENKQIIWESAKMDPLYCEERMRNYITFFKYPIKL